MLKRSWLLVLLLAVPLLAFVVSVAVQAHSNSELRTTLQAKFPNADAAKVAAFTMDQLCNGTPGNATLTEICDTNAALNWMRWSAVYAAITAISLLLAIWLAGKLSQRNRRLLVFVFRPGLYLTVIVLVALVVTHAGLAMATIYYGETAISNTVHTGLILAIGLGAGLGVLAMIRSSFTLVKKAQVTVVGKSLDRAEAPELWTRVERAATRLNALCPQNVVVGLDPNFFVTEADVTCLSGKLSGRTLYCSMPLCRILTEDELDSIIGHELGHFKGEDTKFSERFYPIYRGTALSLQSLSQLGSDGAKAIPLLPAIATLSFFYESFSTAESRLSRDREFVADAVGADLTSPFTLATALVKVHAFTGIWSGFDQAAGEALREGKVYTNASVLFASAVAKTATPANLEGLADRHMAHPTDTHPPLQSRLHALKQNMSDLGASALAVSPAVSALASTARLEFFEQEVTHAYQLILAHRLGIKLAVSDATLPS